MLENMYHNMTYEELARETRRSDDKLAKAVLEKCEKRHDNVLRDIENLNATYAQMGFPKVGEGYYTHPNTGNQQHREFLLTHEQCIDLITGYRAQKLEVLSDQERKNPLCEQGEN